MAWRVVKSLTVLRTQINAAHPVRGKGADGTVGDLAHSQESTSDHNPEHYAALGSTPVVCALDITHDPAHGCDSYAIAEAVRASRDPRCAYIISNHRIASNHPLGNYPAWAWRPYTGSGDPHTGHAHFSTVHTAVADSEAAWTIHAGNTPAAASTGDDDMGTLEGAQAKQLADVAYTLTTGAYGPEHARWAAAMPKLDQTLALLATIAKAQGVAQADIDDIQARTGSITLTDTQVAALAKQLNLTPDVLAAAARAAIDARLDDDATT